MEIQDKDLIPISGFAVFKSKSIDWIIEYKNIILYSICGLLVFLFVFFQIFSNFQRKSQNDFIKANFSFQQWVSSSEHKPEVFELLNKVIKRHPELHPKFDGLIVERLLGRDKVDEASAYVKPMFERIKEVCPYHAAFASTSLNIAQGKLQDALMQSKKLKTTMENDASFWESQNKFPRYGSILYAYNLLRIALLQKNTGTSKDELSAWNELQKIAGWSEEGSNDSIYYDPEAYHLLEKNFRIGSISILDYIQHRKNELSKF